MVRWPRRGSGSSVKADTDASEELGEGAAMWWEDEESGTVREVSAVMSGGSGSADAVTGATAGEIVWGCEAGCCWSWG